MGRMSAPTFWTGPHVLQGFKDAGAVLNMAVATDQSRALSWGAAGRVQVGLDVGGLSPLPPLLSGALPLAVPWGRLHAPSRELAFYLPAKQFPAFTEIPAIERKNLDFLSAS